MGKMPEEYFGKVYKKSPYVKTNPREWTKLEVDYLCNLNESGVPIKVIASKLDRSEVSVSVKLKRLGKKANKYDSAHFMEKKILDTNFINIIKPDTILALRGDTRVDDYGISKSEIINDVNVSKDKSGLKIMCEKYILNSTYDVIDLDTFSSSYDSFDLAIKLAKKGLIITFGEMGHRRFRRLDFVKRYYGINSLADFTLDNLILEVQKIALRSKKQLEVIYRKDWNNVSRVWFKISDIKVLDVQIKDTNEPKKVKENILNPEMKCPTIFDFDFTNTNLEGENNENN